MGPLADTQARSQKFRNWGGAVLEAGGEAFSARKFCIILQNELNFRAILIEIMLFKTLRRNWQPSMIQLVALMGYMGSG